MWTNKLPEQTCTLGKSIWYELLYIIRLRLLANDTYVIIKDYLYISTLLFGHAYKNFP